MNSEIPAISTSAPTPITTALAPLSPDPPVELLVDAVVTVGVGVGALVVELVT
ncbi:MAG: hypothetical protein JOY58_08360 [Solirubrobacterales bacterium]|nr:hypothetical protein [Solirubrobacterales bacterium]MBV9048267.1 hypothetical protein [Solirubrobacterales bacterium]